MISAEQHSQQEMRFLLTQRCTYRCVFCHGEGLQSQKRDMLTAKNYAFLYRAGKEHLGFSTVTLTGGEPLVRRDVVEIARGLKESGAFVTLTTNGELLQRRMAVGKYLDKMNVSVHALDQETYDRTVQRTGTLRGVLDGLHQFRELYPDVSIVFNSTINRGLNYSEAHLRQMAELAKSLGASIKYVELFPNTAEGFVHLDEVRQKLSEIGFNGATYTARKTKISDGETEISLSRILCSEALMSGDPEGFCRRNNDLFVSPSGDVKPCRNISHEIDILNEIHIHDAERLGAKLQQSLDFLGKDCQYKT